MSQQIPASALNDPAILQLPALTPPPGVVPNFTNPENKGPRLIVFGAILLTFVIIALANRAYTKLCIVRKTSWDDLTISLSALGAIVSYTVCVLEIQQGVLGRHQYELRLGDVLRNRFAILSYIIIAINGPTLWVTKFTFSLLYLHIFWPIRWLRICIYLGATLFTVFYWSLSIALFILSTPTSGETWAEVELSPRLDSTNKLAVPVAVGGLIVDIWLLVLPIVAINKLQFHNTRRIGLTIIFSTGLIAVAASAASIYIRHKVGKTEDKTWTVLDVDLLYLVEVDAGIITACMPSFAKMLHHHLPAWAILKQRLKSINLASPSKSSTRNLVTASKDSRPTHFNKDYYRGDRPYINGIDSSAEHELENLKGVKNYIRGTDLEVFDDDRVYLKHDPQQE